ncbi:hypothetical protein [Streptomyces mirabilis]|uniref:hypothetical protein n=1 Tax=Streptomyces mirabilis TaxID=68239 RepID=UPI003323F9C8
MLDALAQRYPWAKQAVDDYLTSVIDNAVGWTEWRWLKRIWPSPWAASSPRTVKV